MSIPSIAPFDMPVKTTEYAFIPQAVPLRISRSGYAARRKCLRPNPGPPKSEGLVLRIYTYDKCRRTDARNPMKKRVSVKKSSAFLLTKIKIKNHDAQFAGRPEGMHPGVDRPLPCPCGAFQQPAGMLQCIGAPETRGNRTNLTSSHRPRGWGKGQISLDLSPKSFG